MTISSTIRKAGPFTGNDSTTDFPFAFKVFAASDLYVVKTNTTLGTDAVLVLNTDYTVSLNANQDSNPGGSITLPSVLATGFKLTITSSLQYLQPTDLTNNGGFYPKVITNALDRLTIFVQQLYEQVTRSLKVSVSTPAGVQTTLPAPAANRLIGWNATADNLQNMDPTALATIVAFGTANADLFDGDGVTTQFALSANPGALNNLDVSIGGVTQTPGIDYTWTAGTTITFTSPPPVGTDNVLVRYMQGLPQGTTAANLVSYTPPGVGAVDRTVESELDAQETNLFRFLSPQQIADVQAGTLLLDVNAAINAAIDSVAASGGGVVWAPPGTYFNAGDSFINIKAGVTLRGAGASTRFVSGTGGRNGNHNFVYLKDGSAIEDCRLSGSNYLRQSGGGAGICFNKIGVSTQGAASGQNFRVSRVGFEKFTNSHVFVFDGHRDAVLEDCYTFGQQPGQYVEIDANYAVTAWNATYDSAKVTAGTQVYCLTNFYNSGSGVVDVTVKGGRHLNINDAFVGVNGNSSKHTIVGNIFRKDTAGYYGGWGIDLATGDECVVAGNYISGGSAGAHLYGSANCVVSGNIFAAERGVWLEDPNSTKNTITGNTIKLTNNMAAITTKIGVSIQGAVNNNITGNIIDGQSIASAKGCYLETLGSGALGNTILGNTFANLATGIESANSSNDANWAFGNVFRSVTTPFPRQINSNHFQNVKGISGTASNCNNLGGTVVISDTATSAAVTLTNAEPDTSYRIMLTPRSSSGSPASGAFVPVAPSSLTTGGFTVNVQAAPGAGNAVSYNWLLFRA